MADWKITKIRPRQTVAQDFSPANKATVAQDFSAAHHARDAEARSRRDQLKSIKRVDAKSTMIRLKPVARYCGRAEALRYRYPATNI